ncbi:COG1678 Putative transcriptional regulator [Spirosomataceae bacterium]
MPKIQNFLMNEIPNAGKVLIAEPFLGDPNFERSVVLICEHNKEGSFGLVLNNVSKNTIADVVDDIYAEFPLFIGGPVEQNTLHFVHRLGHLIEDSIDLGNGIFWSGDFESIKSLLSIGTIKSEDIRFFIGYSGWGAGQLGNELAQNTWFVSDINSDVLFEEYTNQFWRTVLKRMGGDYKVLANYPVDPRLN